ncbi:VWA domain-containing protein [Breoghania sp. JC706]|uniref:VWA domain-containing protein n=1 Tax=Breoghania sp. JC706 TaxID=3117732 RepID=UPI00300B76A4
MNRKAGRKARKGRSILLPAVAAVLALVAVFDPSMAVRRQMQDALVIVDITRSMNVRDMGGTARLEAAKRGVRAWIAAQPCGTRVGLGLFTERRSLTLLTPIDVCDDFESLTATLDALDWRMAWEGDSRIAKGLNHALARAQELGVALVFVTDGQEAPPLPYSGPDAYRGSCPRGLILGVGGIAPAPIPKFDETGREIGFYDADDVQHAPARLGPPPADAASRPGYHARNNPYGEADLAGHEHLSELRADYLKTLAAPCGLAFERLAAGPDAMTRALDAQGGGRDVVVRRGTAPYLGGVALALLVLAWIGPPRGLRFELRSGGAKPTREPV